ncbi:BT4734/BF3469 family protein [Bacteroides sp. f07]|uniref:BT4734/BF3469 family protein n=1 Tax=Bacteroides sp. f07 TaxID=3132704 RepID=UPI0036F22DF2
MKLTLMRDYGETSTMRTLDINLQIEAMKHETKARPISNLRTNIRYASPDSTLEEAQRLTKVIPAANFRKTANGAQMTEYNGIVQIEVNHLANRTEVNRVKQEAAELTQTFAAFMGSGGHSVKIWLRFTRPDNSLPKSREEAEIFQAHAYRKAVSLYQPALSYSIELKNPTLEQFCRQTYDPELYYNSDATVIYMRQPLEMPSDTTYKESVQAETSPFKRLIPGYDSFDTLSALFESALSKAYQSLSELQPNVHLHSDEDLKPLLVRLAENCFQAGIPEEETARWAIAHFYTKKKEFLIRQTVQNIYTHAKGFGQKSPLSTEQELELRTEEFMQRRYEFRYNTMTTVTEYRERNTFCFCFRPITNRVQNSIAMNARLEGLSLWDRDVARYLNSDRIPIFNPIEDFLFGVDVRWDGRDRIRELAARVPCNNGYWPDLFYRWFLSMVAHWRHTDRKYSNCTVPLLVGPQGYRKSTFCRNLLPSELQIYYTDHIDFSNKRDAELSLNRFALINMDEFDQNGVHQQAFLKHIIQKPVVNTRRPRATATQEMRRYASFIGTSNHKDLLTDTSGSRRYIVVYLTAPIDCSPIDYEQLYAQAMHDIYRGERYWFDTEDEKVMTEGNQEFQVMPIAEQLFHQYFRAAREDEEEYEQLLAIEILEQVQHDSRIHISNCNIIQFGRILQRNQVPSVHAKRGNVYKVVRIKPKRE